MTEQQWLNCADPETMLNQLQGAHLTDRQCWLFLAASYRRVFPFLEHIILNNEEGKHRSNESYTYMSEWQKASRQMMKYRNSILPILSEWPWGVCS